MRMLLSISRHAKLLHAFAAADHIAKVRIRRHLHPSTTPFISALQRGLPVRRRAARCDRSPPDGA
jgi:hypothetical protein